MLKSIPNAYFILMRLTYVSLTCSHAMNQLWDLDVDYQVLAMPVRNKCGLNQVEVGFLKFM